MRSDAYPREQTTRVLQEMVAQHWITPADVAAMLPDFDKPAGHRCQHQRSYGCSVYARRPFGCRYWNCRWLVNDDTADLSRPDRSRYVIDLMPDFVCISDDEDRRANVEVIQIWCDPKQRDAWRDPKLLAYLDRRGKEGKAAIIRFSEDDAIVVFPPSMSRAGEWRIYDEGVSVPERDPEERLAGLAQAKRVMVG
jgi:hypothetical protein